MEPYLAVDGLSKSYDGVPAVRGLSFTISPAETYGLLGPNGAGKSTTISCLYGLVRPDAGRALIGGLDVRTELRRIKALAGIVPQDDCLDPDLSVEENLWVYGHYFGIESGEVRRRADELLRFVELADHRKKKVPELSGGMRRRLLIGRALINQPKLLILDEPTTGLDPQARHLVWSRLRELKRRGVTMLLTTHYMDEAQMLCDRLAIMDHGRMSVESTPRELIDRHVGASVVELHAPPPGAARPFSEAGIETHEFEDIVYLFPRDQTPDVLRKLSETGVAFASRPANLEDVFLKIVGRGLRD
ncbi:ABC transporter ATP-binding protein [bacterium]|nr:ABC transporter ATP-binding protein [bacterium]